MSDEELEEEMEPPSADRVAARALALAAVAARGIMEQDAGQDGVESLRQRIISWSASVGLDEELEEQELALLNTPLGELEHQSAVDAVWRFEGLAVLAWALIHVELPAYDSLSNPRELLRSVGFLSERPPTILENPRLRSTDEIARWALTYLSYHWRLREFWVNPGRLELAQFVAEVTWAPLTVDELRLIDGDLSICGHRIDLAPAEVLRKMSSIAHERHLAFNWLLGHHPTYSEVTTDT